MRPAYETIIEAIKKDLNRIEHYEWERVIERLMHIATPPERLYMEEEIKKLKYEYATVMLGKLILGLSEEDVVREITGASGSFRTQVFPDSIITRTKNLEHVETNPNQLELNFGE
jgi:hypothetical protein